MDGCWEGGSERERGLKHDGSRPCHASRNVSITYLRLKNIFIWFLAPFPQGGPGGGSGRPFCFEILVFLGGSGPDPGEYFSFKFDSGPKRSWDKHARHGCGLSDNPHWLPAHRGAISPCGIAHPRRSHLLVAI